MTTEWFSKTVSEGNSDLKKIFASKKRFKKKSNLNRDHNDEEPGGKVKGLEESGWWDDAGPLWHEDCYPGF